MIALRVSVDPAFDLRVALARTLGYVENISDSTFTLFLNSMENRYVERQTQEELLKSFVLAMENFMITDLKTERNTSPTIIKTFWTVWRGRKSR